jgi:DNA-binding transcriptional ArsR family regulator
MNSSSEAHMQEIANPEFRRMLAERIKALGDPTRILLLHILMEGERCVQELAQSVDKSQATVSKHLAILHRHGYISQRKSGVQTFYKADCDGLQQFCEFMCNSMKEHIQHIAVMGGSKT